MPPDNQQTIDDFISSIAKYIQTGKVIPIIGYDMLDSQYSAPGSDKDFLKNLIKVYTQDTNLESLYPRAKTGSELVNEYYHELDEIERPGFKISISQTIQRERFRLRLIPDSYRKLVSIKCFNLFINATITNSLELAMNTFRGTGNTEDEIKSSYTVFNYDPNHPDDLPFPAPPNLYIDFGNPIIYNLFGTHDADRGDYILTDADHIELIYELIKRENERFANLLSFLNEGYLLFLGCNFPDWFFRFFIRICVGERLDSASPIKKKAVIDTLNSIDASRTVFISQYRIRSIEMDCNVVVDKLYEALGNTKCRDKQSMVNNKVLISYCRADEDFVRLLIAQLDAVFIDYFVDFENMQTGDALSAAIQAEINKCCLVLPVVSGNIQRSTPYVWREWSYIVNKKEKIWPIFREFVDQDMFAPADFVLPLEIRSKILNKNTTLGIIPGINGKIIETDLRRIKETQYLSRVSGKKQNLTV